MKQSPSIQLRQLGNRLLQVRIILFTVILLLAYGFISYRIFYFHNAEPDPSAVSSKINAVKRPQINQSTINKVNQLEDTSVEVQTLFNEARNNPFGE